MDALFGLPRKKLLERAFEILCMGAFFGDQCAVDEYVAAHKAHGKAIPKVMLNEDVLDEHFHIV